MPMYNLTQLQEALNMVDVAVYANDTTGGILFGVLMMAVFFISMMAMKRFDFDKALLSSSFGCFLIGSFFTYAGVLHIAFPLAFLTVMAFTGFYMYMTGR